MLKGIISQLNNVSHASHMHARVRSMLTLIEICIHTESKKLSQIIQSGHLNRLIFLDCLKTYQLKR